MATWPRKECVCVEDSIRKIPDCSLLQEYEWAMLPDRRLGVRRGAGLLRGSAFLQPLTPLSQNHSWVGPRKFQSLPSPCGLPDKEERENTDLCSGLLVSLLFSEPCPFLTFWNGGEMEKNRTFMKGPSGLCWFCDPEVRAGQAP